MATMAMNLPAPVVGTASPYPTVTMVTTAHQKDRGMESKGDWWLNSMLMVTLSLSMVTCMGGEGGGEREEKEGKRVA